MALTDLSCKNAKCGEKPKKMADSGGLYLYLSPSGAKLWRMKYRFMDKEKTLSMGQYPNLSLGDARKQRDEAKELLKQHVDPSLAKTQIKQQARLDHGNTFEAVAREWLAQGEEKWAKNTANDKLTRLERDMFPQIGKMAVKDITPKILLAALRKVEGRGSYEVAKRLLQTCNQIFFYAVRTEVCPNNPALALKGVLKTRPVKHFSAIEAKELPEFLSLLKQNKARLFPQTILAIRFMLLTFVRTGEMINAKWPEIDFKAKEWHIPAERMKMRRAHIVPLSRQAIAILEELKEFARGEDSWIFPSVLNPRKPISNNTVLQGIKRMGYNGRMTGHGFRAMARTILDEVLHVRPDYIEHQLAHAVRDPNGRAYNRTAHLDERRKMMQKWSDYVDATAQEKKVIVGHFGRK